MEGHWRPLRGRRSRQAGDLGAEPVQRQEEPETASWVQRLLTSRSHHNLCVRESGYVSVCTMSVHVCLCICVLCTLMHAHVCVHVCLHDCTRACRCVWLCAYKFRGVCMHVCMFVYVCDCVYMCVAVCTCT